jgi:hypothetical protein
MIRVLLQHTCKSNNTGGLDDGLGLSGSSQLTPSPSEMFYMCILQLSPFAVRFSVSGPGMWGRRPADRPTGPLLHTQELGDGSQAGVCRCLMNAGRSRPRLNQPRKPGLALIVVFPLPF